MGEEPNHTTASKPGTLKIIQHSLTRATYSWYFSLNFTLVALFLFRFVLSSSPVFNGFKTYFRVFSLSEYIFPFIDCSITAIISDSIIFDMYCILKDFPRLGVF